MYFPIFSVVVKLRTHILYTNCNCGTGLQGKRGEEKKEDVRGDKGKREDEIILKKMCTYS